MLRRFEKREVITNNIREDFWGGDECPPKMVSVHYSTEYIKNHWMVYFKKVNFLLCKFYLSKDVIKTKKFQGVKDGGKELCWEHINSSPNYYRRKKKEDCLKS